MSNIAATSRTVPKTAKILVGLMTVVITGIGLVMMMDGYAPDRWTRFGYTPALFGPEARHFGSSVILTGLLPLLLMAKSPSAAAIVGSVLGGLLLLNVLLGARLWA